MKASLALALLLAAPVVLPASYRASTCSRQVPHQHLQPLRIVRSPQAPKTVRPVLHGTRLPISPAHAAHPSAGQPRHKA